MLLCGKFLGLEAWLKKAAKFIVGVVLLSLMAFSALILMALGAHAQFEQEVVDAGCLFCLFL